MRAIIWTKYGAPDGLQIQEVEKPEPKDNEVRIKVYATTVTAGDSEVRSLKLPILYRLPMRIYVGFRKPKRITILGQELAGKIDAVGKDVALFKVGDRVFGSPGFNMGAYAEYACMSEKGALVKMDAGLTYEEAAAIPIGGLEALHFIRQGNLQPGKHLLINGAGGSIGTYSLQLARLNGAEVTAVDSGEKLEMLRKLGADHVIDYQKEDFTRSGNTYDAILDVVGKSSYSGCIRSLKPNGYYLLSNPGLGHTIRGKITSISSSKKVIIGAAEHNKKDLIHLLGLIGEGKLKPVVDDRRFELSETADAHSYVDSGKKRGNVVIQIGQEE